MRKSRSYLTPAGRKWLRGKHAQLRGAKDLPNLENIFAELLAHEDDAVAPPGKRGRPLTRRLRREDYCVVLACICRAWAFALEGLDVGRKSTLRAMCSWVDDQAGWTGEPDTRFHRILRNLHAVDPAVWALDNLAHHVASAARRDPVFETEERDRESSDLHAMANEFLTGALRAGAAPLPESHDLTTVIKEKPVPESDPEFAEIWGHVKRKAEEQAHILDQQAKANRMYRPRRPRRDD